MRTSVVVAAAAILLPIGAFADDAPKPSPAATAPAQPAPPPPSDPATAAAQTDANGSYTVRLHDLERRVNELKEQIFRSKARLNLLKETVLHGVIAGARAVITHRNEMGSMYTPIRYVYALDGQEIFSKIDESGKMGDTKEIEVFNGSITPGNHTLSVQMVYQGNGYGVFSYLKGYKFTAKSSRTFTAPEGKQLQLKVVGFEKGNPVTTDPKDRPAVDFRESLIADKDTLPKSSAPAKK
ncbi:MAG TPA: dihydrolipoamide acetyltransferase [Polyangia bacterium]|nr:dihydrolipoamide acetyltransferase [Polyangia bacterium]